MATKTHEPSNPREISTITKQQNLLEEARMNKLETATDSVTDEDFISGLPDELIANILSFIPTRSSVATTVLSKRWNRVWTLVPNLDFGSYDRSTLSSSPVKESQFVDFVDRVLSLNNSVSVRTVDLCCHDNVFETRADAWMRRLVAVRDCEVFRVRLPNSGPGSVVYSMPDCFFDLNNLVELALGNVVLQVPPQVCFPRLKTIYLDNVQFPDDDSMKHLMSGCPSLTRMSIFRGFCDNVLALNICSSTLELLQLILGYCEEGIGHDIVIDAPKLTDLDIRDEADIMNYDIINLSSLVSATLEAGEGELGKVFDAGFCERLLKLLRKISHVKELALASNIVRSAVEMLLLQDLPVFNNLTKLTVTLYIDDGWSGFPHLFYCMPTLHTFILDLLYVHPNCKWSQPYVVPCCFLSSLEHVTITSFEDCEQEMDMVSYFLMNTVVLKKLSVESFDLDLIQERNIRTRLMALPKCSPSCQVEYKNSLTTGT